MLSDRIRPNSEAAPWVVEEVKAMERSLLTEEERRTLLDLIDEEHSRDRRTHEKGRTTAETFAKQSALYSSLRTKLVLAPLADSN